MKKRLLLMTSFLSLMMLVSACSGAVNDPPIEDTLANDTVETSTPPVEESISETKDAPISIDDILILMGKNQEESLELFEGGQTLYSADGDYLIGSAYNLTLYGVDTELFAALDTDSRINSINAHLGEDNFEAILSQLENELGQASAVNDTPSEAGYTSVMWRVDGNEVYLYKGYGTVDLQLIAPVSESGSVIDAEYAAMLPDTVTPLLSESEPYPLLESFIINYFDIPEEAIAKTHYYYNYIDLNGEGRNEIFAIIMGPYTSGSGGDTALIAYEYDGQINDITTLSVVRNPIIVCDSQTKGMRDLIINASGGGMEKGLIKLTSTGEGNYQTLAEGIHLDTLEGVSGQAILANDLLNDIENNTILTLKK